MSLRSAQKSLPRFFIFILVMAGVFSVPQIFGLPFGVQTAYAAISFVGSAENSSTPTTDTTVTISGLGLVEGDLVIVACAIGDDDNVNHDVLNNTTGYTEVNDLFGNDSDDTNVAVFYKFMGATPDTSVVCEGSTGGTDSSLAAVVMAFRGVDQVTPMDVTATTATGTNDPDVDPPSIDWSTSGVWTVIAGASGHLLNFTCTSDAYVFPTGYTTNAIECASNDTNDISVGMGYNSSPADPENPGIMDHNGTDAITNSWAAFTMALRPALPSTFTQSAYHFFNNANSTDVGSELTANQDTAVTLGSTGDAFRLRLLLHIGAGWLSVSNQNLKLQFAQQSGTCDTGFSGESYADVTGATVIAYNNNATPADGDNLTANAQDPTHGGDTIVNQDYEEANNFTNTVASIPLGQDGKWDFSLIDNGATESTAYCFRVVKSDNSAIETPSVVPQITTAASAPAQTLTFSISDNSIGYGTLSSSAAQYATGDLAGSGSETVAHTISASTNATDGYIITVQGATLTSGANTVNAIGGTSAASSPGSEQFGLRITASGGNGSVTSPYNHASNYAYAADGSTSDEIASDADGDDVTTTYSIRYLGNISAATDAGSYTGTMTYVITAAF